MIELLGQIVSIWWARTALDKGEGQADMWHTYRVEKVDHHMRAIKLQGINEPRGREYTGPPIWVPLEHVAILESSVEINPSDTPALPLPDTKTPPL